jgi:hypothetical protein
MCVSSTATVDGLPVVDGRTTVVSVATEIGRLSPRESESGHLTGAATDDPAGLPGSGGHARRAPERPGKGLAEQQAAVRASREALSIAELRYTSGLTTYLNVLDAQRSCSLRRSRKVGRFCPSWQLVAVVQLYRALGVAGTRDRARRRRRPGHDAASWMPPPRTAASPSFPSPRRAGDGIG